MLHLWSKVFVYESNPPFSNIDPNAIKQIALNKPSVAIANALIREKFNIFVHKETLRRYLKKLQN